MRDIVLNNGIDMPVIGYGMYKITNEFDPKRCALDAIESGYRRIDTATLYKNESYIGEAISYCGIAREELFITSKFWTDVRNLSDAERSIKTMLYNLKTSYIDMLLIHWPTVNNVEVWKAMEKFNREGIVRAIGVSNFKEHHIEEILCSCEISPAIDQVELHPIFQQKDLRNYCDKHNITVEAWSPLLRGKALEIPKLVDIAIKYGKSVSQIILRYDIQNGISVIPKSIRKERMLENLQVFDFELEEQDMKIIESLDRNARQFRDPDNHGF